VIFFFKVRFSYLKILLEAPKLLWDYVYKIYLDFISDVVYSVSKILRSF